MTDIQNPTVNLDELCNISLYRKIDIPEPEIATMVASIINYEGTTDQFCPKCGELTTFITVKDNTLRFSVTRNGGSDPDRLRAQESWPNYEFKKSFKCARNREHDLILYFKSAIGGFIKVGQFPSAADIATGETRRFRKILGEDRLKELNKALGLNAHGIGAGAFVYLRRVFESLVEDAYERAKIDPDWDDTGYATRKMDQKIKSLRHFLPVLLVEQSKLYGVLSEHIHALSEEECLDTFPLVKNGIFAIVEEQIEQARRQERIEQHKRALSEYNSKRPK